MLGNKIKQYRKDFKVTQLDLAKKCGVGRSTLSEIESGKIRGTIQFITKLSQVTDKPISYWVDSNDNLNDIDFDPFSVAKIYIKQLYEKGLIRSDNIPKQYQNKINIKLATGIKLFILELEDEKKLI